MQGSLNDLGVIVERHTWMERQAPNFLFIDLDLSRFKSWSKIEIGPGLIAFTRILRCFRSTVRANDLTGSLARAVNIECGEPFGCRSRTGQNDRPSVVKQRKRFFVR